MHLPGLVFLVFLTLKLTKYIDWSWWWVLSPMLALLPLFFILAVYSEIYGRK